MPDLENGRKEGSLGMVPNLATLSYPLTEAIFERRSTFITPRRQCARGEEA